MKCYAVLCHAILYLTVVCYYSYGASFYSIKQQSHICFQVATAAAAPAARGLLGLPLFSPQQHFAVNNGNFSGSGSSSSSSTSIYM